MVENRTGRTDLTVDHRNRNFMGVAVIERQKCIYHEETMLWLLVLSSALYIQGKIHTCLKCSCHLDKDDTSNMKSTSSFTLKRT